MHVGILKSIFKCFFIILYKVVPITHYSFFSAVLLQKKWG